MLGLLSKEKEEKEKAEVGRKEKRGQQQPNGNKMSEMKNSLVDLPQIGNDRRVSDF